MPGATSACCVACPAAINASGRMARKKIREYDSKRCALHMLMRQLRQAWHLRGGPPTVAAGCAACWAACTPGRPACASLPGCRLLKAHIARLAGLQLPIAVAQVKEATNFAELVAANPWMNQTQLVVKPDCLFGKRGKHDLVGCGGCGMGGAPTWHCGQHSVCGGPGRLGATVPPPRACVCRAGGAEAGCHGGAAVHPGAHEQGGWGWGAAGPGAWLPPWDGPTSPPPPPAPSPAAATHRPPASLRVPRPPCRCPPTLARQVVDMDGTVGRINTFIVEPFVAHAEEYYLCIQSGRLADTLSFSEFGGMEIEENWDKVGEGEK